MALVTVPNVELLHVGQKWHLSTGDKDFSVEDIAAAIASQDDPAVRTPIIKLGHIDPRFDGQPAVGRIINLRASDDGMTLIGDLVGLPEWLTTKDEDGNIILSSAFPRRSIEGMCGVVTATGNKWSLVLTGVALLGSSYPAITTLDDIEALYSVEGPVLIPADDVPEVVASSAQEVVAVPGRRVMASVSMDQVRTAYYDNLGPAQCWWWIRTVLVDPFELIVDDDEGQLFRVPVTVSGETIAFGDAVPVVIEYRDQAVAAGARIAASYGTSVDAGRPVRASEETVTPQGVTVPPHEEVDVNLSAEVLQKLGLPADATEDQINAALATRLQEETPPATPPAAPDETVQPVGEPAPTGEPATPSVEQPEPEAPGAVPPPTGPAGVTVPEGLSLVDTAVLEDMQRQLRDATELVTATRKRDREAILASAVREGKIMAAQLGDYRKRMETDADGTIQLLAALSPGLVPVELRGSNDADTPGHAAQAQIEYPAEWGNTVKAAQSAGGSRVKVVGD